MRRWIRQIRAASTASPSRRPACCTHQERGLSQREIESRLTQHGHNELTPAIPLSAWRRFLAQFQRLDGEYLRKMLIEAPLVEELIYRWALVTALAAVGLRWTAVVISGAAFGYLHVRYGVAAPNNVAAGFVFAWM